MAIIGRKTLKSERARMQAIDAFFSRLAKGVLAVLALFALAVWVSELPILRLRGVEVVGTHALPSEDVRKVAVSALEEHFLFHIRRDNVFLYPQTAVLASLTSTYPRIAEARIDFVDRHTVQVRLREYAALYMHCPTSDLTPSSEDAPPFLQGEGDATGTPALLTGETESLVSTREPCFLVDRDGHVFAPAPEYSGYPFPIFVVSASTTDAQDPVGTHVLPAASFAPLIAFIEELRTLGLETREVIVQNEGDVEVLTNMPWTILWSVGQDPASSVENLKAVQGAIAADPSSAPRVIDLRFGNKVFYR
jgi:hypothetical protein